MTTFEIAALAILSIALAAYVPLILWAERRHEQRMRELRKMIDVGRRERIERTGPLSASDPVFGAIAEQRSPTPDEAYELARRMILSPSVIDDETA